MEPDRGLCKEGIRWLRPPAIHVKSYMLRVFEQKKKTKVLVRRSAGRKER